MKRFQERLEDDLDTPGALAVLWSVGKETGLDSSTRLATVLEMDRFLGFELDAELRNAQDVGAREDIQRLLQARQEAREKKDFASSDRLRDELKQVGFIVEDREHGQMIRPNRGE